MTILTRCSYLVLFGCLALSSWAQQAAAPGLAASAPRSAVPIDASSVHTPDDPDVLRETQLTIDKSGYTGLVWWIPFEFWENSATKAGRSPEKAREALKALREYTIVGVMGAKVSGLGAFDYLTPAELQKKTFVRDANGMEYSALSEVGGDAKNLAEIMRPVLANAMGRAGENFAMIFFPGHDKAGKPIADALAKGQFAVVLKDAVGEPETVYLWRTPLTAFSPARYCPVGKERVHANWDYCPWHGVKLSDKP